MSFKICFFPLLLLIATSCASGVEKESEKISEKQDSKNKNNLPDSISEEVNQVEHFDMSNPAFLMGTNIGSLFNTYFKIGDFEKMLTYTDSKSLKKYSRERLKIFYRKADLGMDLKLRNMTSEKNEKILHYEMVLNGTKIIKRLHVVIENDTARIVPQNPESGRIFE